MVFGQVTHSTHLFEYFQRNKRSLAWKSDSAQMLSFGHFLLTKNSLFSFNKLNYVDLIALRIFQLKSKAIQYLS